MGSAPIVGYHYGAGNRTELQGLLRKSLRLIGVLSAVLTAAAELLARPLAMIFVSYDVNLLAVTQRAFAIYAISFLLVGFNIYASSFFTALNDGFTSALISFARTVVFQIAAVVLLPLVAGCGWRVGRGDIRRAACALPVVVLLRAQPEEVRLCLSAGREGFHRLLQP